MKNENDDCNDKQYKNKMEIHWHEETMRKVLINGRSLNERTKNDDSDAKLVASHYFKECTTQTREY